MEEGNTRTEKHLEEDPCALSENKVALTLEEGVGARDNDLHIKSSKRQRIRQ